MMKIRALVTVILLIMTAVGWLYFADKFEKIAHDEILPRLHSKNSILSFDKDSILIEKYKFRVTVQNAIVLPESETLKIKSDKLVVGYNPFADRVRISFAGDKLEIGEQFYFAKPNHALEFNRSLTKKDFEEFNITIKSENSELYYTKDDSPAVELKLIDLGLSKAVHTDDKNTYTMVLSFNFDSVKPNFDSVFFKEIDAKIKSEFGDIFKNTNIYSEYKEAFSADNSLNYQAHYSAKIPKETFRESMKLWQEGTEPEVLLSDLLKSTKIYSFKIHERLKSLLTRYNGTFDLYGNGKETAFRFSASNIQNPNDIQKQFIVKNGSIVLLNIAKIISEKNNSNIFKNLKSSDLANLLKVNIDGIRSGLQLTGKYNVLTSDFDHSVKLTIDDFDISFYGKGDFENKAYKGTFEISDPKALTDNASQIYITRVKPILLKLHNPPKELNIDAYNQIAVNIQDNGFNALAAFHEDDSLRDHRKLVSNLTFNLKDFQFNINDKNFLEILTDERVATFLQDMPDADKTVDK